MLAPLTDAQIEELVRCGVRCDEKREALVMFT